MLFKALDSPTKIIRWPEELCCPKAVYDTAYLPRVSFQVPVYMMESLRGAHYCSSKQLPCEALELSYVCRALSLLVLLPDVGTSLETLAAALNYAHLRKLMRELKSVTNIAVRVTTPITPGCTVPRTPLQLRCSPRGKKKTGSLMYA